MMVPLPFRADDQHLYNGLYHTNKEVLFALSLFVPPHRCSGSFVLVPQIRNNMGQSASVEVGRRPSEPLTASTIPKSSSTSPDPFHRSPIPLRAAPPTKPKLDARPSLLSLRKLTGTSTSSTPPLDDNLPKPPTLGERVVRKISESRRPSTPHISSLPPLPIKDHLRSEQLVEVVDINPNPLRPLLPTSLDSSTISGPSTSLMTPSGSRRNLPLSNIIPFTPINQIKRPTYHRRGSSNSSTKSIPKQPVVARSPKTRSRAEKEWRAKVAAVSASAKIHRGIGGESPAYKGPVPPPRRRPGPGHTGITIVPIPPNLDHTSFPATPGHMGPLPPHLVISDKSSPGGKSFTSNKSFETLGHHTSLARSSSTAGIGSSAHTRVHIRTMSASPSSPLSHHRPRSRKASIPRSVTSFYADPDQRGGTRPNSLAASTFLSPIKAERNATGDEGRKDQGVADNGFDTRVDGYQGTEGNRIKVDDGMLFELNLDLGPIPQTPIKSHTLPLPSSNTLPVCSHTPPPISLTTPDDIHTPTPSKNPYRHSIQHSSTPPIGFGPETPRSKARKERILSLPTIRTSPKRSTPTAKKSDLQVVLGTDTPSPSVPSLLSFGLSTPTPTRTNDLYTPTPTHSHDVALSTPLRPRGDVDTPTTPYSPMTAYILSAENIDLTFPLTSPTGGGWSDARRVDEIKGRGNEGEGGRLHPFASFLDAPSPARIKEIASVEESRGNSKKSMEPEYEPLRDSQASTRQDKPLGITSTISTGHTTERRPPPPRPPQHPLRSKTPNGLPNSRMAILGSESRQEKARGKVENDLCPGMGVGGGNRPPKRGMDVSDLEKWLAGTR